MSEKVRLHRGGTCSYSSNSWHTHEHGSYAHGGEWREVEIPEPSKEKHVRQRIHWIPEEDEWMRCPYPCERPEVDHSYFYEVPFATAGTTPPLKVDPPKPREPRVWHVDVDSSGLLGGHEGGGVHSMGCHRNIRAVEIVPERVKGCTRSDCFMSEGDYIRLPDGWSK